MSVTYILVDGENIDATLGMSVLGRRPDPNERPRWDRVFDFCRELNRDSNTVGLFFINSSSGQMPMAFVQALISLQWRPIPLSSENEYEKVVDLGIQKTLNAILEREAGDVILVSHDVDFIAQVEKLLSLGRRVTVLCFREFLSCQLAELTERGLEVYDLETDVQAFTTPLPRVKIIPIEEFDPYKFLI